MSPSLLAEFVRSMNGEMIELSHDEVQTNAVFWLQGQKYLLSACGESLTLLALDGPDKGKSGEVATLAEFAVAS